MRTYFSKNLKRHRKYNNLTISQLSNIINISEETIMDYESGKASPDEKTLLELAKLFNVSTDFLTSGESIKDCYIYKDSIGKTALTKTSFFSILILFVTQIILLISNILICFSNYAQISPEKLLKATEISALFLVFYNIFLNILLIAICVCIFSKMKFTKIMSFVILFVVVLIMGIIQTGIIEIALDNTELITRYFNAIRKGKVIIIVMFTLSAVNMINHNRFVRNTYHNYHNRNNIKDRYL